jgi:hypothetical protein
MIPVMLIAIGVAYGVHLYSHLYLHLQEYPEATRQEAVQNMIHEMWKPVMMAAVTKTPVWTGSTAQVRVPVHLPVQVPTARKVILG